jgi:asparagine N-glycosylation enzyme membrane subunit Stt3
LQLTELKKWAYIGIAVIVVVVAIAVAGILLSQNSNNAAPQQQWVQYSDPRTRYVGGKYNTTLILMAHLGEYDSGDIKYTQNNVTVKGYFFSAFEPALQYFKNNTPENSTILSWWDYGNMIIGYSERNVIATSPSPNLLPSITNTSVNVKTDSEEKLQDIAKALATTNPQETLTIMKKYNATYIYVATGPLGDEGKANWILTESGIPADKLSDYWSDGKLVNKATDTVIYKILHEENIPGLSKTFSDANNRIYQITG